MIGFDLLCLWLGALVAALVFLVLSATAALAQGPRPGRNASSWYVCSVCNQPLGNHPNRCDGGTWREVWWS